MIISATHIPSIVCKILETAYITIFPDAVSMVAKKTTDAVGIELLFLDLFIR